MLPALALSLLLFAACGGDDNSPTNPGTSDAGPTASFTSTQATGTAPLQVSFVDTSRPGTSPITSWAWEFGDGGTSSQPNPVHSYENVGSYDVSLRVTTAVGSDTRTSEAYVQITALPSSQVNAIVEAAGVSEPEAEDSRDSTLVGKSDIGDYRYVYQTYNVTRNIEDITYLGLNDDIIWPGSIINGSGIHQFDYEPIVVSRAPITLSVDLETAQGGGVISREIVAPELSTVRQGISDLLADATVNSPSVAARVEFKVEEVFERDQMDISLAGTASKALTSVGLGFDFSEQNETTKLVAQYKQIYFSIDMDTPQSAAELIGAEASELDLTSVFTPGSWPMYVAGVRYGMMAIMTIESSYGATQMKTAVNLARSGKGGTQVEGSGGLTAEQMMCASDIKMVVYGGSTKGLENLEFGFDGFMKVIQASSQFTRDTVGVPLAYKFRHLADNTIADVTQTGQWTKRVRLRIRQPVRITALRFECTRADDEGPDNTIEMDGFQVRVWASEGYADGTTTPIDTVQDAKAFWYYPSDISMDAGDKLECEGKATNILDITFNTDPETTPAHDLNHATLRVQGYLREDDSDVFSDAWDYGSAEITLKGDQFLAGGGEHKVTVVASDFTFDVLFRVEFR